MTTTLGPARTSNAARTPQGRLLTRSLILLFLSDFGATVSFYLLLSVVPLYVASLGVGTAGAGMANGALLLAGVAAELVTPRLAARYGYRRLFAAGLLLLGLPALVVTSNLTVIAATCAARGLGFGITAVVGAALVAEVVPAERRGEGLGLYGVVAGVPSVIALPAGVWLSEAFGYGLVFALAALLALAGLAATRGLPTHVSPQDTNLAPAAAGTQEPTGSSTGSSTGPSDTGTSATNPETTRVCAPGTKPTPRNRVPMRPALVFGVTAMAAGAVVTFLPLATTNVAAVALLVQSLTATASRWWAGRVGDRYGSARLLVPSVALSAVGIAVVACVGSPLAVLAGMALFGAGFGVVQNASLAVMFDRAPASAYGSVSAMWNLAYDGGMGLGGTAFGLLAATTGYSWAYLATAALIAIMIKFAK
ncbi:MFS transporter [Streptosporangiaceae bacterium NEAU-GS5]|nr:MFS transporter [Streptosporangiaceae bacterium NEAU-GS5]